VRFENKMTNTIIEMGYDYLGRRFFKKVTESRTVTLHQRYIYRGYLQIACVDMTRGGHPALWFVTWDPTQKTKNVCEVFGPAGYIRESYSFSPFGEYYSAGDVNQPLRWSSEYYDSELDLVYYNFRHYSPTLGRWLSRDPIEEQGGLNLYAFVGNNATFNTDFLGREERTTVVKKTVDGKEYCKKVVLNGCGSKGSEWVPDSYFWIVNFTPACDCHDECYAKAGVSKDFCDSELRSKMKDACREKFRWSLVNLSLCLLQSEIYLVSTYIRTTGENRL